MTTGAREKPVREAGLAELINGLTGDITLLIRQEVELAKRELARAARSVALWSGLLVLGSLILLYGLFFLFFSAVFGIGTVLPAWASSLIIGGGLAGIGLLIALPAVVALVRMEPLPRTIKTIRENGEWLRRKRL
ncbi:MAG: phage holin family protein [Actinobacteria bacterium]|nr:phage holin family protein [Actinomycetota bacterium]